MPNLSFFVMIIEPINKDINKVSHFQQATFDLKLEYIIILVKVPWP